MKLTTINELKGLMTEHFLKKMESVDRARRGEEDDYPEENEGTATTYESVGMEEESVDRANRGEETDGEYEDEDEGAGVTYEHLRFFETNLYSDADKSGGEAEEDLEEKNLYTDSDLEETNLYSDADKEGGDDTKKKGKSHAHPSGAEDHFPMGEGRLPSMKEFFLKEKKAVKKGGKKRKK